MTPWETTAVSFGVSIDVFVVALALGTLLPQATSQAIFRSWLTLTIPSLLMLISGQYLGEYWLSSSHLAEEWMGPLAISWLGATMVLGEDNKLREPLNATSRLGLILVSLCASADVFAAGLVFGMHDDAAPLALIFIPAFTVTFALAGLLLGTKVHKKTGRYAEIAGGSLLISIAQYCCFS